MVGREARCPTPIAGPRAGLAGFGKIGRTLASKAQAFGLEILAYDPYLPQSTVEEAQTELVDLDALLARSDSISVHTPLTAETRHLFNSAAFDKMKRGAVLINTSRGGLVDEEALAHALEAGKLGGAALDVLSTKPPPADSRLLYRDDVILTPHVAYYWVILQISGVECAVDDCSQWTWRSGVSPIKCSMTHYSGEATVGLQRKAAEEVVHVLRGSIPRYPTNPSALNTPRQAKGGSSTHDYATVEDWPLVYQSMEFRR